MDGSVLISAREAFADVREGQILRRKADAQIIRALCDLAACYRVSERDLIEPLAEKLVMVGGEGTPTVSDQLRLEVQGLLGCSAPSAACQIADAINLKFRHPLLYEAVQELGIEAPRALRAARRCAQLDPVAADTVTSAWLPRQAGMGWTAAMNLLDKLIIEADEALAAEKERRARAHRGVWVWGLDDGVMNVTGRLDVLDARLLDVRLDEVADLLQERYPLLTHQQRRAKGFALLAEPARALALLQAAAQGELPFGAPQRPELVPLEQQQPPDDDPAAPPPPEDTLPEPPWALNATDPPGIEKSAGAVYPSGPVVLPEAPAHRCDNCGQLPAAPPGPGCQADARQLEGTSLPAAHRGGTTPVGPVGTGLPLDASTLAPLRPSLGIALHIHSDALGNLSGAARIERAGHITRSLLTDLLGEGGLSLKIHPVIDLPMMAPADGYVASPRMRRAVFFAFAKEPFPFSNRQSVGLDIDHTVAFRPGRRGQTCIGNLGPFTRGVHRAKTAGFWVLQQIEPGRMVWTSPLGVRYEVSEWGTLTVPAEPRSASRRAAGG